ncbi:unnamed protein product, partial [Musa acuminata var. zebrina]
HTRLYSCLTAGFLLVLGHFACKYVSSNKLQRCNATAHRTEQNSPKTAPKQPKSAPFSRATGSRGELSRRSKMSAISDPWNPPGGTGLDGASVIYRALNTLSQVRT